MKYWMIAFSGIKKRRGAAVSLCILILLASMILNIGLNLLANSTSFYRDKVEELHGPHNIMVISGNAYMPEYKEFFENDPRVNEVEVENVIAMETVATQFAAGKLEIGGMFFNTETQRKILPFQPIESIEVPAQDAIYLPVGLKVGAPAPGEVFTITHKNRSFDFIVAGYFESSVMSTTNTGMVNYFLADAAYQRLYDEIGGSKLISVRLHDTASSPALMQDFTELTDKELADDPLRFAQFSFDSMEMLGTFAINLLTMALMGFSVIVLAVALLVTKFRISGNIEDSIETIGALGAMGYTSGQIRIAMVLEFAFLAITGSVLGTAGAYAAMPAIAATLTQGTGLVWENVFHPGVDLLGLLLILAFVLTVTTATAARIKHLPPVVALRGGIRTHSFYKNSFPLEKRGPLQLKLAGKYAAKNNKQNVMLLLIFGGITMTLIFIALFYSNIVTDQTALIRMVGMELSDVMVTTTKHTDAVALAKSIETMEGVRKTGMADMLPLQIGGLDVTATISDCFEDMETLNVYEGTMPKYEGEVAITGVMADVLQKKTGDMLEVKAGGVPGDFQITGIFQSTNLMGRTAMLPLSGLLRLMPDHTRTSINVYLEEGQDIDTFIDRLNARYSALHTQESVGANVGYETVAAAAREKMTNLLRLYDTDSVQYALLVDGEIVVSGSSENHQVERLQNFRQLLAAQTFSLSSMTAALMQMVLVFSALMISLILYMIIRAMIQKRKKEFGIYSAIGYTTFQLMTQIALSILPVAVVGVLAGGALGCLLANPLFTAALYNTGISHMQLVISVPMVLGICIGVIAFTYLASLLVSRKIRKISVYNLLTE